MMYMVILFKENALPEIVMFTRLDRAYALYDKEREKPRALYDVIRTEQVILLDHYLKEA